MICLFDGYDRFTSNIFISQRLWTFVRHILLFVGVYERSYVTYFYLLAFMNVLTSHTFLSWWFWLFDVKAFSFLIGTNVSRHQPLFLDGYGCFALKPFLSWQLRMFPVKTLAFLAVTNVPSSKIPWSDERPFFLTNPIIPLLFPYLLPTYNAIGSGLVTFQSVWFSNGFW